MATSQNLSEQDILNQLNDVDLSKVETSFPLLAPGIVPLTIGKVELRRDVEKKGMDAKPYYFVEYSLAQPWKTIAFDGVESKPVNPGDRGATFNERIYIIKPGEWSSIMPKVDDGEPPTQDFEINVTRKS